MLQKNKYQIAVDINEEVASIIDRLKKTIESNIEIFIPNGALILRSIVNLKLLQREADKESKKIYILVNGDDMKSMIQRAGLNLVADTKENSKDNEDVISCNENEEDKKINVKINNANNVVNVDSVYRRESEKYCEKAVNNNFFKKNYQATEEKKNFLAKYNLNNNKSNMDIQKKSFVSSFGFKLFFFFLLISLILATIVIFLVLPTVDIKIATKTENISANIQPTVDSAVEEINFSTYTIPGHLVETSIEESQEFPTTGEKKISEKAVGKITVYNEWSSQSQTLVKTTRFLSSSGKLFRAVETVVVPGAVINAGKTIPGTAIVNIEADLEGEEFNINPTDFTIPGFEGTVKYSTIYGKSTEPMSGGKTKLVKVVSEADIEKAKQILKDACIDKASSKLKDILAERKAASDNISDNLKLLNYAVNEQIINESSSLQVGEEGEKFTFNVKVKAQGIVFDEDNLKEIVKEYFKSSISEQKETVENAINISYKNKAKSVDFDKGKMVFEIDISQLVRGNMNEESLKNMIAGKNEGELQEFFTNMHEIEKVEVSFWPFWVKKVPVSNEKINISFE